MCLIDWVSAVGWTAKKNSKLGIVGLVYNRYMAPPIHLAFQYCCISVFQNNSISVLQYFSISEHQYFSIAVFQYFRTSVFLYCSLCFFLLLLFSAVAVNFQFIGASCMLVPLSHYPAGRLNDKPVISRFQSMSWTPQSPQGELAPPLNKCWFSESKHFFTGGLIQVD